MFILRRKQQKAKGWKERRDVSENVPEKAPTKPLNYLSGFTVRFLFHPVQGEGKINRLMVHFSQSDMEWTVGSIAAVALLCYLLSVHDPMVIILAATSVNHWIKLINLDFLLHFCMLLLLRFLILMKLSTLSDNHRRGQSSQFLFYIAFRSSSQFSE